MAAPLLFSVFQTLPYPQGYVPSKPDKSWLAKPPVRLSVFEKDNVRDQTKVGAAKLDILFPSSNSVFALSDVAMRGVRLKAEHGKRPLAWLVNGVPIDASPWKRNVLWKPAQIGFYTITVLDQNGQHSSRHIRIQ